MEEEHTKPSETVNARCRLASSKPFSQKIILTAHQFISAQISSLTYPLARKDWQHSLYVGLSEWSLTVWNILLSGHSPFHLTFFHSFQICRFSIIDYIVLSDILRNRLVLNRTVCLHIVSTYFRDKRWTVGGKNNGSIIVGVKIVGNIVQSTCKFNQCNDTNSLLQRQWWKMCKSYTWSHALYVWTGNGNLSY